VIDKVPSSYTGIARRSAQPLDDMHTRATLAMVAVLAAIFTCPGHAGDADSKAADPPYCKGLTGILACVNGVSPAVVERKVRKRENVSCLLPTRVAVIGAISSDNLETLLDFFARDPHRGRILYALGNDQRADLLVTKDCTAETAEVVGFRLTPGGWEKRAPGELE
jgi:hypothetical protein